MNPKIAIGVPHVGDIPGYFMDTFVGLIKPPDNTMLCRVQNKPIDLARNLIVKYALDDPDITHVFFMDADMRFHPHSLKRLIDRQKPVVGGVYISRTEEAIPHAYYFHHEDDADGSCPRGMAHQVAPRARWYHPLAKEFGAFLKAHPDFTEETPTVLPPVDDSIIECDALATGALLIEREVLEAMRDAHPDEALPWFKLHRDTAGGEDFYFCEQAKALGYGVWADFSVLPSHEFRYAWMDREDFRRRYRIGQPDEHDFDKALLVAANPSEIAKEAVNA